MLSNAFPPVGTHEYLSYRQQRGPRLLKLEENILPAKLVNNSTHSMMHRAAYNYWISKALLYLFI